MPDQSRGWAEGVTRTSSRATQLSRAGHSKGVVNMRVVSPTGDRTCYRERPARAAKGHLRIRRR